MLLSDPCYNIHVLFSIWIFKETTLCTECTFLEIYEKLEYIKLPHPTAIRSLNRHFIQFFLS